MALTVKEFKEKIITKNIEVVHQYESRPEFKRGGIRGLKLCRSLNSMLDFQEILEKRHKKEIDMVTAKAFTVKHSADFAKAYWEYRCATVQIEYVFEHLLAYWHKLGLYSGPLSAKAIIHTDELFEKAS